MDYQLKDLEDRKSALIEELRKLGCYILSTDEDLSSIPDELSEYRKFLDRYLGSDKKFNFNWLIICGRNIDEDVYRGNSLHITPLIDSMMDDIKAARLLRRTVIMTNGHRG